MENTYPLVRYVRCPKCLTLLTEISEIPVYKCGGCGTILRAKVRSNGGQILNSVPQNLDDSDPSSSGSKSLGKKIPDSDVASVVEQAAINNLSISESSSDNICKEKSLGHEQNEINNLNVSEFNGEIHKTKREPWGFEGSTSRRERLEDGNEELEKSPDVNSEVFDSRRSSDKLVESSESMDHFRMTSRSSSQAYDGSVSSIDEDRKNNKFRLSRRTFRNKNMSNSSNSTNSTTAGEDFVSRFSNDRLHSAANVKLSSIYDVQTVEQAVQQNWKESENHESSSYPAEDVKVKINQRFSEQDSQVKFLSRFDELRNDLTGMFNDSANSKESSHLAVKTSQLLKKTPSKEHRSSLIPFSRQPSSSYFHNYGDKCCHNEHCRPCPCQHNICCHLSEPAILPRHIESNTMNLEPKNPQFKVSRTQSIIRLCRPVSGGAPFVMCYNCFKLLQLPVDFLVSPKRVNKLRCGACSQVLMYFFRPRSRSIPQTPVEDQHPPSVENNDELNVAAADKNLALWYEDISAWDPISSSESNSSEVEPVLHKSRSFNEIVEEEQGEGGLFKGSRLHNLMGYSSASEILLHDGYSYDKYRSTETPKNYRPSGRKRWDRR